MTANQTEVGRQVKASVPTIRQVPNLEPSTNPKRPEVMTKRVNPYSRLLERITRFCREIKYAHRRTMFTYPRDRLNAGWRLDQVYERVSAADQIGYECVVIADDTQLRIEYRKKVEIPYEFR